MRYLGLDYGAKRVGVAVSDAEGKIAFPRATLQNGPSLVSEIAKIALAERVKRIVVGDTRSHGGMENPITPAAEHFIKELAGETGLPVSPAFEAWTSVEVSRFAPPGKERDDAAAAVILQRYLDMHAKR